MKTKKLLVTTLMVSALGVGSLAYAKPDFNKEGMGYGQPRHGKQVYGQRGQWATPSHSQKKHRKRLNKNKQFSRSKPAKFRHKRMAQTHHQHRNRFSRSNHQRGYYNATARQPIMKPFNHRSKGRSVYRIKRGDNLHSIARKTGVSAHKLIRLNRHHFSGKNKNHLRVGQRLRLRHE